MHYVSYDKTSYEYTPNITPESVQEFFNSIKIFEHCCNKIGSPFNNINQRLNNVLNRAIPLYLIYGLKVTERYAQINILRHFANAHKNNITISHADNQIEYNALINEGIIPVTKLYSNMVSANLNILPPNTYDPPINEYLFINPLYWTSCWVAFGNNTDGLIISTGMCNLIMNVNNDNILSKEVCNQIGSILDILVSRTNAPIPGHIFSFTNAPMKSYREHIDHNLVACRLYSNYACGTNKGLYYIPTTNHERTIMSGLEFRRLAFNNFINNDDIYARVNQLKYSITNITNLHKDRLHISHPDSIVPQHTHCPMCNMYIYKFADCACSECLNICNKCSKTLRNSVPW
jgi:hypothetical protein